MIRYGMESRPNNQIDKRKIAGRMMLKKKKGGSEKDQMEKFE